ncbi:hypothetical protein OIU83_04045 [Flavobacterium sp. LS1R49]|uniref:Fibronectin type-III domain-containing protein n=1 Tax=Flavobacterium shii TaxID=2987687 RepID=A0A9X3C456_9FLAO|nr:hypothetical protein [Flavobacterium shii]MCV9926804.1 hypothetical protein [Flavobacterium shii]
MKKKITLLFMSFFILVSCRSEEDNSVPPVVPVVPVVPIAPSAPTATQAVLNGNVVDVSWPVVVGTGITYNVYRNGNPVKINTVPLSEPKFTDVLASTGTFSYSVTANSGSLESIKGVVSDKVILELPKTKTVESITSKYNTKTEYIYTYETTNITKLVSETLKTTTTRLSDQTAMVTDRIGKYTYNGDLIEKIAYYNVDNNAFVSSIDYVYNEKKKLVSVIRKKSDGSNNIINYVYNDDGTTTMTNASSPNFETWVLTLEKGNLVKYVYSVLLGGTINYKEVANCVFDTNEYVYKNVFAHNNFFGTSTSYNNEISSSVVVSENGSVFETLSSKSEYTYNENGYFLTKKRYDTTSSIPVLTEKTTYTY